MPRFPLTCVISWLAMAAIAVAMLESCDSERSPAVLPDSRNTTYAPKSQVKSADLNEMQDVLIDHEERLVEIEKREFEIALHPSEGHPVTSDAAGNAVAPPNFLSWWGSRDDADSFCNLPIALPVGSILKTLTVHVLEPDGAGEVIDVELRENVLGSDTQTVIGGTKPSGSSGAAGTVSWSDADSGWPVEIETGKSYAIRCRLRETSAKNESRVLGAVLAGDRPFGD